MLHNNVPQSKKPKARLRATGEIIRKNGTKEPVTILGDPDMTQAEMNEQLREEYEEQQKNTEVK